MIGSIASIVMIASALHRATANFDQAASARSSMQSTAKDADSLARVFARVRAAEVAEDRAQLDALARESPSSEASIRIALAREAISLRAAAHTAEELRDAEMRLVRLRADLAHTQGLDNLAARELLLECVEDMLLRALPADGSDAVIAIGIPSAPQRASATEFLARVQGWLAEPALQSLFAVDSAIATNPAVFRAHALAGLATLAQADLTRSSDDSANTAAMRTRALALLTRAGSTELPIDGELSAILALARARADSDAALRTRLLHDALRSRDETTRFVAQVESWRDRSGARPFPEPVTDRASLALLAATAQASMRVNEGATPVDAALRNYLVARSASRDAARQPLLDAASTLASRIDAPLHALADSDDAPRVLFALAVISSESDALLTAHPAAAERAAADPLVMPWFSLRYARFLASRGETARACEHILNLVNHAPTHPSASAAMAAALTMERSLAARDAAGERGLDNALAIACTRLAHDDAHDDARDGSHDQAHGDWLLERVDLALFPRWSAPDLDRAAQTLLGVSTSREFKTVRDFRALEIEYAGGSKDAAELSALSRRVELITTMLEIEARSSTRAKLVLPRAEVLRAALALALEHPREAMTVAARAFAPPIVDARAAARAASVWISAATSDSRAFDAPPDLIALAAADLSVRDALMDPIARVTARVDDAWMNADRDAAATLAREQLLPMTTLALLAPSVAPRALDYAAVWASLATGAVDRATARARTMVASDANDRAARWILAECLLHITAHNTLQNTTNSAREEAFSLARDLAPLAAPTRDSWWWRAQLMQLEMLSSTASRATDIASRLNRLEAMDSTLGEGQLSARWHALRAAVAASRETPARETPPRETPR